MFRTEYHDRLKEHEAELAKSKEERRQMAERAKDIRTRVIKPFQERLELFVQQVQEALAADCSVGGTEEEKVVN
jgi:DNA anti-recombination protein RmuC